MPRMSSRKKRIDFYQKDIPAKANRILNFVLIAMILILLRIWHLSFIQYDQKIEESQKPQQKTIIEPATRATIRDRFNLPLAINKISYQATILYSHIKEIPSFEWQKDSGGKRNKIFKRKIYIHDLAKRLAQELNLSAERIEDLIHSKASYYSSVPFVLKEDLSEEEYYTLKMMEKDWPGLHVRHLPKRLYPMGRVAADVIGYLGAINRQEYEKILHEIKALEQFIQDSENGEERVEVNPIQNTQQARRRLRDLQAKAYTIHDYVGKTGIEGIYEEQLRGFYGKKKFHTDSKGNFLRELPGSRPPLSGDRILLTLSAELQEYAEQLLAQNENLRIVRKSSLIGPKQTVDAPKEPWIKGGAIVVMDPITADILALASYPRFDPNDFVLSGNVEEKKDKQSHIHQWLENENHLAELWNQQIPLKRERYDTQKQMFYHEEIFITWNTFLDFILPLQSQVRQAINQIKTISQAIRLQQHVETLLTLFPGYNLYDLFNQIYLSDHHVFHKNTLKAIEKQKLISLIDKERDNVNRIKKELDPFLNEISHHYDKVLLIDLCRLAVSADGFTPHLIEKMGEVDLENYHHQSGCLATLLLLVKERTKKIFHDNHYKDWRIREEKIFLKNKRLEEKTAKIYPKPYLDYLDQHEQALFQEFWSFHCWEYLHLFLTGKEGDPQDDLEVQKQFQPYFNYFKHWHQDLQNGLSQTIQWRDKFDDLQKLCNEFAKSDVIAYFKSMRSYEGLTRPLLGSYRYLRKSPFSLEKNLAAAFYPTYGFGYGRSYAYRQSSTQGSLFKLVTAYEVLVQRFQKMGRRVISPQDLNPLIIIDEVFQHGNNQFVGYTEEGKPIPQVYKGGRIPRSLAHKHNGRVDLLKAIEVSSNPYFALLAGECLDQPGDLAAAARLFSFGTRTGIQLSGEIPGYVPQDLATNRTGLYAMAIGQHTLVVTPLQTAVMLAAIMNGGKVMKPKVVKLTAGRQSLKGEDQIVCLPTFPYQESLSLVGIDFPLFTAVSCVDQQSLVKVVPTEIQREIFMPQIVRQILLKGLLAVTQRTHQENLTNLSRLYRQYPEAIRHFTELKNELLGKTSTSESVENLDLDLKDGTNIYTHVWFGSAAFERKSTDKKAVLLLKDEFGQPELIVVVYLRYGGYGKEAAPLAAQIVKKWREIRQKHVKTEL